MLQTEMNYCRFGENTMLFITGFGVIRTTAVAIAMSVWNIIFNYMVVPKIFLKKTFSY